MYQEIIVDQDEFHAKKKARIEAMRRPQGNLIFRRVELINSPALPEVKSIASAPTNHEVAGFMPGRLEFEHEVDNDAELVVKDFEFGLVLNYGGDEQPQAKITRPLAEEEGGAEEPEENQIVGDEEDRVKEEGEIQVKEEPADNQPEASHSGAHRSASPVKHEGNLNRAKGKGKGKIEPVIEIEEEDELEIKLTLLDIYFSKLDKREEAKDFIFDRGLTEHKRVRPLFDGVPCADIAALDTSN